MNDAAQRLRAEGLVASPWSNGPGDRYSTHEHPYDKVIVCVDGSIDFGLPGQRASLALEAGDRLELPAGTSHDARVGPHGVHCLEAHVPAGTLLEVRRRKAGEW